MPLLYTHENLFKIRETLSMQSVKTAPGLSYRMVITIDRDSKGEQHLIHSSLSIIDCTVSALESRIRHCKDFQAPHDRASSHVPDPAEYKSGPG